jgi:fibronectin type 3 domain-containing protein
MKRFFNLFFLIIALPSVLFAQEQSNISLLTSPKGVYVRLEHPFIENKKVGEATYIIKRRQLLDKNEKTVGLMALVKNYEAFQALVGIKEVQQFEQMNELPTNAQTMAYLNSKPTYNEVALFAELKIEFLQAMGFAFLDTNVPPNELYEYSVWEVINGKEQVIGEGTVFHSAKNYYLNQVKPQLTQKIGTDSSLRFQWEVNFTPQINSEEQERGMSELQSLFLNIDKEADLSKSQKEDYYKKMKGIYVAHPYTFSAFPIDAFNTAFNIYYRYNDDAKWRFLSKNLATPDSTGKNIMGVRVPGNLDDIVEVMLIPEDYVHNLGDTTQIYRGVIAHNGSVELIYGVSAKDTTNAIILNWKKLSNKPYYTGIEIAKSSADMSSKVIQILPVSATTFEDNEVYPAGTLFTYHVRPLFIELQGLEQDVPAQVAITCSKFNRPTPPYNLKVTQEGESARLKWEVADEKASHSFYIYRGTSPTNMIPIRSAVKALTYLDTTSYLTGRMTYYYSVMAVNVTQDTSDFAPYVSYVPYKQEFVQAPATIGHDIVNGEAVLNWPDVILNDDFIIGYIVQRKKEGDRTFTTLTKGYIKENYFTDSTFQAGVAYLYRIGTVVANGDTASVSPEVSISLEKYNDKPYEITDIELSNLSKGIKVSWPSVETTDIVSYKIYRKLPTEENFKLLDTIPNGNFDFEDKTVLNGIIYSYTVTSVNQKQVESDIAEKKTMMREIPK